MESAKSPPATPKTATAVSSSAADSGADSGGGDDELKGQGGNPIDFLDYGQFWAIFLACSMMVETDRNPNCRITEYRIVLGRILCRNSFRSVSTVWTFKHFISPSQKSWWGHFCRVANDHDRDQTFGLYCPIRTDSN